MTFVEIVIGSIIVEQLLQGVHNHPLWKIFEADMRWITSSRIKNIFRKGLLCKFCQSFWLGWIVGLGVSLWTGWSWDWIWGGIVISFGSNIIHNVRHILERIKSIGIPEAEVIE